MSKFFIRRPIVAIVIAILTVILGVVSMLTLPTAQYPDIAPPEIQIQANYAGADAKTLLESVSTPLEQQITGVDNMLYMYSVNANNGQSQIFVDFDVKTNPDTDQILTQLRVSQAQAQLPAQATVGGITVQKSLTSPLMIVALSSPDNKYDAASSPTTPSSILRTRSRAYRVWRGCRFSAGRMRCASGWTRASLPGLE